jgi:hypothetical protein
MCSTSSMDPVRWFAGSAAARWMLADRDLQETAPVDVGHGWRTSRSGSGRRPLDDLKWVMRV